MHSEFIRDTGEKILQSTLQFYNLDLHGDGKPFASGLLLEIDSKFFAITAAHVIAEEYNSIYIHLDTEVTLSGKLFFSGLPLSGDRHDDKIDIGVLQIMDMALVDRIKNSFRFLTIDDLLLNHKPRLQAQYLSVGFPVNKTILRRTEDGNHFKAYANPYKTIELINYNFEKRGFNSLYNKAFAYDGKIVSDQIKEAHQSGSKKGISGSGLWTLDNNSKKDHGKLIGVVIEIVESTDPAMIVTTIDLIIEVMRQKFDLNIAKSNSINVNLESHDQSNISGVKHEEN